MRSAASRSFLYIATLGPVGFMPVAPGTFGTAVCAVLLLATRPSTSSLLIFTLLVAVIGTVSAHFAEIYLNKRDPGEIVVDEFAGFLVTMLFIDITTLSLVIAFFLFRLFDIIKPPPIRYLEHQLKGGMGVVMDDLMAGVYANLSTQLCLSLIKIF
ncbi:MAG: phosphatidylglycerophosphatase A [Nitrospirota bacterium]|nr:MAG: phosphatidylglycerophosphatase A [Nitrospirota bacterium]